MANGSYTLDEFFEDLAGTRAKAEWMVLKTGAIRGIFDIAGFRDVDNTCCPGTVVFPHGPDLASDEDTIARHTGLSWPDAAAIVAAADQEPGYDPALRARLLATLGLEERVNA